MIMTRAPPLLPRCPDARLANRWGQEPGDPRGLREPGRRASPGAALEVAVSGHRVWPGHKSGLRPHWLLPRPGPGASAPPSSPATVSREPQRTVSLGVRIALRSGLGRSRCKTTCSSRGERPRPQPASLPRGYNCQPYPLFFFFFKGSNVHPGKIEKVESIKLPSPHTPHTPVRRQS